MRRQTLYRLIVFCVLLSFAPILDAAGGGLLAPAFFPYWQNVWQSQVLAELVETNVELRQSPPVESADQEQAFRAVSQPRSHGAGNGPHSPQLPPTQFLAFLEFTPPAESGLALPDRQMLGSPTTPLREALFERPPPSLF